MNEVKDALLRMVKAGIRVSEIMTNYADCGVDDSPLFDVWGNILDGIYALLEEHTETIEESVTYQVMTAPYLFNERRAEMLYAEYRKRHPKQPAPNIMSSDGMKELYEKNGGYMTPEGDWK